MRCEQYLVTLKFNINIRRYQAFLFMVGSLKVLKKNLQGCI